MAKFHFEITETIRAPREEVFAAATDYESMPKWSKLYTSVHITKREGNIVYTDVETKARGQTSRGTTKYVEIPPERIELVGESGNGASATVMLRFEPSAGGSASTNLVYVADYDFPGAAATILGPLARGMLQSTLKEEGRAFAAYVEGKKESLSGE